jgi:two-component system, chemotaxis family, CheB/CheR fusion protein
LRAANEELQSINEEYRSTSEELETSKEELQSINEELQTVNSELKLKLEAISRAHSDLQNLVAATDIGTLFLDSGLRIKRFTDRVTELFSITQTDEGRPITDFAHQLEYHDLIKDARSVLADLAPIRREVPSRHGRWFDMRLRPYRTVDDKIDGVVITFVDISERHIVEQALRESERRLAQEKRLVDLSRDPIFVWEVDGGIVEWNRGSEELYGFSREEAIGRPKEQLLRTTVPGSSFGELKSKLIKDGSWVGELRQRNREGHELLVESRLQLETFDSVRLVLESTRDITERRAADRRQHLLLSELTHRVRNILTVIQAIARHTLRRSKATESIIEQFEGRLSALANAHNLLVESDWRGADLAELAQQQLRAHSTENPNHLRVEGEPIVLPPDLATPFGLVLHELATNAAKHGALSTSTGRVTVTWSVGQRNNQRVLTFEWKERGGPKVAGAATSGFGSTLIQTAIPGAQVNREFRGGGFVCTIELDLPESV